MRGPTKKQLTLIELVDQGLSVEEIATRTGKLVASVHKQLNRVRRKVREGHFAPSPLPIERAAAKPTSNAVPLSGSPAPRKSFRLARTTSAERMASMLARQIHCALARGSSSSGTCPSSG